MCKRILAAVLCIPFFLFSQQPDATVLVNQSTLNGFLSAVGPVSGQDHFNVLGMKGTYTWEVKNARIELHPGTAKFIADASVKVGPIQYGNVANGDVEVKYNQELNRIKVKVLKATFEVYTKIFGKKVHIADVDVSKFYRPEFEFAGPTPVQPSVTIELPGGNTKTIFITPVAQNLRIEENQIVVTSNLKFSDKQ
jgi:hypothetical protein